MNHSDEPVAPEPTQPIGPPADPGRDPQSWGRPSTRSARRPWRRTAVPAGWTVLALTLAGAPLGLLWSWLSPSVPVVDTASSGAVVSDPSPEQFIAADGWFSMLGAGFGVLAAVAAWLILRRHRGPGLLLAVVLGVSGGGLVAWQLGRRLGLAGWQRWQATAVPGDTFHRPPDLHAHGALLVPAFAAVIVCTLLAGWSNDPDLDVPGARPGYGHDPHEAAGPYREVGTNPADRPDRPEVSSDWPAGPDPTAAPVPPGPGPAAPPRG